MSGTGKTIIAATGDWYDHADQLFIVLVAHTGECRPNHAQYESAIPACW